MEAQKPLVTGGTGTLGRRVIERLSAEGREARVMSRSGRSGTVKGDLLTGEGIGMAVRGVDKIIHLASSPKKTWRADVGGTEHLLQEAAAAGVNHVIYISIVGVDRNPFYYYQIKRCAERVVERSPVPWIILRSTQFHDLILRAVGILDRSSLVLPVPKGFLFQPIDTGEVAHRLVELALSSPAGRAPDVGGPEARTAGSLANAYLGSIRRQKRIAEVPVPGRAARAFREGAQVAPGSAWGATTWEEFLGERFKQVADARGTKV